MLLLGFGVLLVCSLSKIPLFFINLLSPKPKKEGRKFFWGKEILKYQKYETLNLLLPCSTYADNMDDLYGWGDA